MGLFKSSQKKRQQQWQSSPIRSGMRPLPKGERRLRPVTVIFFVLLTGGLLVAQLLPLFGLDVEAVVADEEVVLEEDYLAKAMQEGKIPGERGFLADEEDEGHGLKRQKPIPLEPIRIEIAKKREKTGISKTHESNEHFKLKFYSELRSRRVVLPPQEEEKEEGGHSEPTHLRRVHVAQEGKRSRGFAVQLGAFGNMRKALEQASVLYREEAPIRVFRTKRGTKTRYQVRLGPFETRADAAQAGLRWRIPGYPALIMWTEG
ncbi:SPOR domain-containing protein [Magnetococcales bacterium HHB-1]